MKLPGYPAAVQPDDVRLSLAQVAQLLGGASERHVHDLIARGELESRRIGRRVVIPLTSYRAYLQRVEQQR